MVYPNIKVGDIMEIVHEEQRMLAGLLKSLKTFPPNPNT